MWAGRIEFADRAARSYRALSGADGTPAVRRVLQADRLTGPGVTADPLAGVLAWSPEAEKLLIDLSDHPERARPEHQWAEAKTLLRSLLQACGRLPTKRPIARPDNPDNPDNRVSADHPVSTDSSTDQRGDPRGAVARVGRARSGCQALDEGVAALFAQFRLDDFCAQLSLHPAVTSALREVDLPQPSQPQAYAVQALLAGLVGDEVDERGRQVALSVLQVHDVAGKPQAVAELALARTDLASKLTKSSLVSIRDRIAEAVVREFDVVAAVGDVLRDPPRNYAERRGLCSGERTAERVHSILAHYQRVIRHQEAIDRRLGSAYERCGLALQAEADPDRLANEQALLSQAKLKAAHDQMGLEKLRYDFDLALSTEALEHYERWATHAGAMRWAVPRSERLGHDLHQQTFRALQERERAEFAARCDRQSARWAELQVLIAEAHDETRGNTATRVVASASPAALLATGHRLRSRPADLGTDIGTEVVDRGYTPAPATGGALGSQLASRRPSRLLDAAADQTAHAAHAAIRGLPAVMAYSGRTGPAVRLQLPT